MTLLFVQTNLQTKYKYLRKRLTYYMEKMQSALVLVRVFLGFILIEKGGFKRIR